MKPISLYELACHRGAEEAADEDGALTAHSFFAVGLPFFGGCRRCGASIGPFQAFPARDGFLRCGDCIASAGWSDVETANQEIFA